MPTQPFNTPVLLIIFNRTDCLQRVFQRIREIQPAKLYLAADGPRSSRPDDKEKCEAARHLIINNIDWPCQFITHLNEQNLGCGRAVSSAISWFFEQEEAGIILEDDCLVDSSFFPFAQELLEKYRNDQRIGVISALNMAGAAVPCRHSYLFSRITCALWGWASWRRAWKDFDLDCKLLPELEKNNELFFSSDEKEKWFFTTSINSIYEIGGYNTWDFQFTFANLINSRLSIVPRQNMVQNLGDTGDGTHQPNHVLHQACQIAHSMSFPLIHPPYLMPNLAYDQFYSQHIMLQPPSGLRRAMVKFAKTIIPPDGVAWLKSKLKRN